MVKGPETLFFQVDIGEERILSPEERLLIAIFDRALRDRFCPNDCIPQHHVRSAKWYFENNGREEEFGSFSFFCAYFGLTRKEVRKAIHSREMIDRLRREGDDRWRAM